MRANHAGSFGRVDEHEPEVDAARRELAAKPLDRRREAIGNRTIRAHEDEDRRARGMTGVERVDRLPVEGLHIERLANRLGRCMQRHQPEAQHDGGVSAHSTRTLQVRFTKVKHTGRRGHRRRWRFLLGQGRRAPSVEVQLGVTI